MKEIEYAYTRGMDEDEIDQYLYQEETGVLALSGDGTAYAFPISHYYDGDRLYFRLGITGTSRKQPFLESTETACYVLYDVEQTSEASEIDSWSVILTGVLTELEGDDPNGFDAAEINRQFPPIKVFGEDINEMDIVVFAFEIDSAIGRSSIE